LICCGISVAIFGIVYHVKPLRVTIPNNKKENLVGYLYKGTTNTLIIICHGLESNNHPTEPYFQRVIPEYFDELCRKTGASLYSFDFSGYGESEGQVTISFRQRDADIKSVLDYFIDRAEYTHIILYGFSLGGASVAIAAGKYRNIHGMIAINGFYSLLPRHLYKTNVQLILSFLITNPKNIAELYYMIRKIKPQKITIPALVIHSDKDDFVKVMQSVSFYEALRTNKKFVPIRSDDHMMAKEYRELPVAISAWLKETFRS
jgi:pimeloyl-ACP methyl ester carboxylesterase